MDLEHRYVKTAKGIVMAVRPELLSLAIGEGEDELRCSSVAVVRHHRRFRARVLHAFVEEVVAVAC